MKRLLREPLVQFLALGALLFAVNRVLDRGGPTAQDIVVTPGQIENMAQVFVRVWQRPPTADELHGLVQDYVREEVLAREAVAMGLDRDDTIIRRRLRQKMEFVAGDVAALAEPTEEDLKSYFDENRDAYHAEARFTLRQVYLDTARHGADEVSHLLARLNQDAGRNDFAELGDATLLPPVLEDVSLDEIERNFGGEFATQIEALVPGVWTGPVNSTYGMHLVVVDARSPGREPAFDEVRGRVLADWEDARRRRANEDFYQEVLKKYRVSVEWPQGTDSGTTGAQQ